MRRGTFVRTVGAAALAATAGLLGGCGTPAQYRSTMVSYSNQAGGTFAANGASQRPVFSPDGTKVAFTSTAKNFGLPDTNGVADVFVRDLATGAVSLVSRNGAGTNSGNGESRNPVWSPDGTKIAFESAASNLGPADFGGYDDLFVRDLVAGTTTMVSANTAGTGGGNSPSYGGEVWSPDSSRIAFLSFATNLAPGDLDDQDTDVFVRDLGAGTTALVSTRAPGTVLSFGGSAQRPSFSPDGTKVVFDSAATDVVAGDTNNTFDVFLRDLVAGTTQSLTPGANGASTQAVLSPSGTKVAFTTGATNLGATDTNARSDVYLLDLATGTFSLVSVRAAGGDSGNGSSGRPVFSPSGAHVAFESGASNLGAADTNGEQDIYLRNLTTGTTTVLSAKPGADTGPAMSQHPVFSPDGSLLLFESLAWTFGPQDGNNDWDVYVRTLATGTVTLVSTRGDGADAGDGASAAGSFSPDGKRIAYHSLATDLMGTDGNGTWDVYLASLVEPPPPTSTTTTSTSTTTTSTSTSTTTDPPPTTSTSTTSTTISTTTTTEVG